MTGTPPPESLPAEDPATSTGQGKESTASAPHATRTFPAARAIAARGWLAAHKWLVLRRLSQFGFLALFLLGPVAGLWVVTGTIASSLTLEVLPLTDPLIALQTLLAGHPLEATAIIGTLIVLAVYGVIGGRVYCSWVCPINILTDTAHWLRVRLGIRHSLSLRRETRLVVLAAVLVVSLTAGIVAWESLNPVTLLYREVVFGTFLLSGAALAALIALFLFDLFLSPHGWCGHLCPVGAFYGLVGQRSLIRVSARRRAVCDDCMACYYVCPEPHVISPALKGAEKGLGPVILSPDCTNCGRCIDVCPDRVYVFSHRFDQRTTETDAGESMTGQGDQKGEGVSRPAA